MSSRVVALAFATLMIGTATAFADVPGIATTNTRLHTSPGSRAPIIRRVPQGARLTVSSCADRWCLAEWRGVQGYISQNLMDFPNGSASVDQGSTDDETTTVVRRTYVDPGYIVPDDDYPDYPVYTYGPYYGGGLFIGPGYYGGRYHHWRGHRGWHDGRSWNHNGWTPPVRGPRPGVGPHVGGPGPVVRPHFANPTFGNRPAFHQPGMGSHFGGPRGGGPIFHRH